MALEGLPAPPDDMEGPFKWVLAQRGVNEPLTQGSPEFQSLSEHARLLWDGGYIKVWNASSFAGPAYYPKLLTMKGVVLLENTRDESRWEGVKDYIRDRALPMTPPIIIKVAEKLIEKAL